MRNQYSVIYDFTPGNLYRRKDVYKIIGIPETTKGGNWDTGYTRYKNDFFIFCNVGVPGRTGHNYGNRFIGEDLLWFGKTNSHIGQPFVSCLLNSGSNVYIFYRTNDKDPFTFAGLGRTKDYQNTTPVQVLWSFDGMFEGVEEYTENEVREGAVKTVKVNIYERNPIARRLCLQKHGYSCFVCGFDFKSFYGPIGENFIHVHHIVPLSETEGEYVIDPEKDLIPICPNCHAMIHRKKKALSIEELKRNLNNTNKDT